MRYHDITKDDMKNGDGLRVVLWVSGCSHYCKGCQNPITWDPNDGLEFDEAAKNELFAELEKDYVSGITFSGGDPMYCSNQAPITALAKEIKEKFPDKTIWMYTGDFWEDVKNREIGNYIDVVVEGEYQEENRDVTLPWKGSSNQRVINVRKSLEYDEPELYA